MKVKNVVVSAPGKVIFHGEHAVVYGKPAISASIGLRTTVSLSFSQENNITLHLKNLNKKFQWTTEELERLLCIVKHDQERLTPTPASTSCLEAINQLLIDEDDSTVVDAAKVFLFFVVSVLHDNHCVVPVEVSVSSSLPIGSGLGSSASYSITLIAAMLTVQGFIAPIEEDLAQSCDKKQHYNETNDCQTTKEKHFSSETLDVICAWAFEAEKLMHGKPSGIDNSIGTHGGAIQFLNGTITHLESFPSLDILLIDTRIPRSTKSIVSGVRERYYKYPTIYGPVFEAISGVTNEALKILKSMNNDAPPRVKKSFFSKLEELIDINQNLLSVIGVSHAALNQVCQTTLKYGLHSKMTGAGGGGCAFTLLNKETSDKDVMELSEDLNTQGFLVWKTRLGGPGVVVDNIETA